MCKYNNLNKIKKGGDVGWYRNDSMNGCRIGNKKIPSKMKNIFSAHEMSIYINIHKHILEFSHIMYDYNLKRGYCRNNRQLMQDLKKKKNTVFNDIFILVHKFQLIRRER